jgi:hypothetical protein
MTPCVHWAELKYALQPILHMVIIIITIWSTGRSAYLKHVCIMQAVMSQV